MSAEVRLPDPYAPDGTPRFRLSELVGMRVRWRDSTERPARCRDVVVARVGDELLVRLLVVRRTGERVSWLLPWENVTHIDAQGIHAAAGHREVAGGTAAQSPLRVGRDVLRRVVVGSNTERLGTVRDVLFSVKGSELALVELRLSAIRSPARFLWPLGGRRQLSIAWIEVDPSTLGGAPRPIVLRGSGADPSPGVGPSRT